MSCCYALGRQLYVHVNAQCSTTPLLFTRGPGLQRPDWLRSVRALQEDPSIAELTAEIESQSKDFEACVFAGLGEPTLRLDVVLEVARALRGRLPVRLNTNGLGSLSQGRNIAKELAASGISAVSVGLNAANEDDWNAIMAPSMSGAFSAVLSFVRECSDAQLSVEVTCVETPGIDVAAVEKLAGDLGARFRSRSYEFGTADPKALQPSSLHRAAAEGDLRFDVASAFEVDDASNTALVWAAERGHLHIIERLLRTGAGGGARMTANALDAVGARGNTAVHRAARRGHEEVLRRLLRAGASPSVYNAKQQTPLHFAAFYEQRSCVEALLEAGADVTLRDAKGRRPHEDTKNAEVIALIAASSSK
mmetsp:Transcript_11218/g.29924  ORF Transcript_11218/g.29924 Transcript_11218/m.29924 type:complete len:364 (+) Transcript_11218:68-1159(+)